MKFTLEIDADELSAATVVSMIQLNIAWNREGEIPFHAGDRGTLYLNSAPAGKWEVTEAPTETSSAEIEAALQPAPREINLTPVGLQTPAGAARVAKALDEFNGSAHAVANSAAAVVGAYGEVIKTAMVAYDEDSSDEYADLTAALDARAKAQEEFLRAVAGR